MTTILAFIFVLSILVIVHEFGHYSVSKFFGIGVERFSVGLPPRLFGIQIGETDYCISAIPFGGYVKLTGQSDFSDVGEEGFGEKDYRRKPAPAKIAVLAAGSIMNLITAVVIFFFVYWITGVSETSNRIGFVGPNTIASQLGLKMGDVIVGINGKKVDRFDDVFLSLYTDNSTDLTVKNESGERTVHISRRLDEKEEFGIHPYYEAKIKSFLPDSPAEKAGLKAGDVIAAIDGEPILGWEHMRFIVEANPDADKTFTIERNGSKVQLQVHIGHADNEKTGDAGQTIGRMGYFLDVPSRKVGMVESASMAYQNTKFLAVHTFDFFIKLITGRMSMKLIGGPVMIAQLAGESAHGGFMSLLGFTAFISVNLGVLNLLPFPLFDGGNIVILLVESLFRRKLSEKARMAFQQAGTLLLLLLMVYITINDIMRVDFITQLFGKN